MRGDQRASGDDGSDGACAEEGEVRRRIQIGRLHPALAGAGHAADQRVDARAGRGELVGQQGGQDARVGVGSEPAHTLIGGARKGHLAAGADTPRAQIGGAPIDGNPFSFDGHAASRT